MIRSVSSRALDSTMCDTCPLPPQNVALTRRAKVRLTLFAIVVALAVVATLGKALAGSSPDSVSRSVAGSPGERVFTGDMARQVADAHQIAVLGGRPRRLVALARTIERADREVARGAAVPRRGRTASPRDLRRALRLHIDEDRVIARVEVATGADPSARRAAARLLGESRGWIAALG